ncbi:MAG: hypothetical protein ACFB5Z_15230 [Elainellaceae cyanobacterium]
MTFLYPERPACSEAAPSVLTTPDAGPNGETIRHVLIGSAEGIREAIHVLHVRRYVEQGFWSGPFEIGPDGVRIIQSQGQMMAYLMRQRTLDALMEQ